MNPPAVIGKRIFDNNGSLDPKVKENKAPSTAENPEAKFSIRADFADNP